MKKIIYMFVITIAFSFVSCDNEKGIVSDKQTVDNLYLLGVYDKLLAFDLSLKNAFNEAKSKDDFSEIFELKYANKSENTFITAERLPAKELSQNEIEVMESYLLDFGNSIISVNEVFEDCTKEEFLDYLTNQKELYVKNASLLNSLSEDASLVLEADVTYAAGLLNILVDHDEEFDALNNEKFVIVGKSKSKAPMNCNWFCRNKQRIVCTALSATAVTTCAASVSGCVPCLAACQGAVVAAAVCWSNGGQSL